MKYLQLITLFLVCTILMEHVDGTANNKSLEEQMKALEAMDQNFMKDVGNPHTYKRSYKRKYAKPDNISDPEANTIDKLKQQIKNFQGKTQEWRIKLRELEKTDIRDGVGVYLSLDDISRDIQNHKDGIQTNVKALQKPGYDGKSNDVLSSGMVILKEIKVTQDIFNKILEAEQAKEAEEERQQAKEAEDERLEKEKTAEAERRENEEKE
eukprot:158273_1